MGTAPVDRLSVVLLPRLGRNKTASGQPLSGGSESGGKLAIGLLRQSPQFRGVRTAGAQALDIAGQYRPPDAKVVQAIFQQCTYVGLLLTAAEPQFLDFPSESNELTFHAPEEIGG